MSMPAVCVASCACMVVHRASKLTNIIVFLIIYLVIKDQGWNPEPEASSARIPLNLSDVSLPMPLTCDHGEQPSSVSEQPFDQFFFSGAKMPCHFFQYGGQCPYLDGLVIGDCDMVRTVSLGSQTDMAPYLPCLFISQFFQCFDQFLA